MARRELFEETSIDYFYADLIRQSDEIDDKKPLIERMSQLSDFRGLVTSELDMGFLREEKDKIDRIKMKGELSVTQDQKLHLILCVYGKLFIENMPEEQFEELLETSPNFCLLVDYVNIIGDVNGYDEEHSDIRKTLKPMVVVVGLEKMDAAELEAYRFEQEMKKEIL